MRTIQPDHILAAMASLTSRPRTDRHPEPPVAAQVGDLRELLSACSRPRLVWLRAAA